MPPTRDELLPLATEGDVVLMRQTVRERMKQCGFTLVDQTKMVTAASELGRNALIHGGGGSVRIEVLAEGMRTGIRLTFEDHGPGIADLALAMTDGYSTGSGLGLGLGGSKRLVDEFEVRSAPGAGTRITVARWK